MDKILSVIVPSYNMEAYLPKCLGSLIIGDDELFAKLDVIVVNDGSKDHTSEIAHGFELKYPDVFRVIDKENGHYGSCINAALPKVKGSFVKILDADDSFDPDGLRKLLISIKSCCLAPECDVDVIFTNKVEVNDKGVETAAISLNIPREIPFPLTDLSEDFIASIIMHYITYRTSLFSKISYRQLEGLLFTDSQWVFYPMAQVRKAYFLPVVVYKYLLGRDGQSVMNYWRNIAHSRKVTEQLMADYDGLVLNSTIGGQHYLKARLFARIMLIYNFFLIYNYKELLPEEQQLIEFDKKCRSMQPSLFKQAGEARLFPIDPVGYIAAWRRKVTGNHFWWWIYRIEISFLCPFFHCLMNCARKSIIIISDVTRWRCLKRI